VAHFNYHPRPKYQTDFQLGLNTAYTAVRQVLTVWQCMHWSIGH